MDHSYGRKKSRKCIQSTKKQSCNAQVRIRIIVKFPQYKIEDPTSVKQQKLSSKKLRGEFNVGETQQELNVLVKICGEHTGHIMGQ